MAASWESFEDSGSSGGGSPGENACAASFLSNSSSSDNSGTSPKSAHSDGFYSGSIYSDGAALLSALQDLGLKSCWLNRSGV